MMGNAQKSTLRVLVVDDDETQYRKNHPVGILGSSRHCWRSRSN